MGIKKGHSQPTRTSKRGNEDGQEQGPHRKNPRNSVMDGSGKSPPLGKFAGRLGYAQVAE